MKDSTKDKIQGKVHEVKGAVKERVGRATNNPALEDEGTDEKVGGEDSEEGRGHRKSP